MSALDDRDFEDEPPTTVMRDELVAELTARSRSDATASLASFSDAPTVVAKLSAAEILAAAGLDNSDEPSPTAPSRGPRRTWRHGAAVLIAAALVVLLSVLAFQHVSRRRAAALMTTPAVRLRVE